jgi:PRTRC genetic system protein F
MDSNAVRDAIEHQYERNEFTPTSPLHLAMKLPEEHLYVIGARGDELGGVHPLLLPSVLRLIDRASWKTLFIRTPAWFLNEFSCWHWEGDENASDDEVRELIADYRGLEGEDADRYLPSAVKPEFYPDELRQPARVAGRRRKSPLLSECELLKLRTRCRGMARRVCTELIALTRLLRRAGRRDLFQGAHDGSSAYAACSIALTDSERIGELLDDHFEQESQSGEYTLYSGFSPFASTRGAIRRQYADWALAFQIVTHLDRLLALVTL